MAEGKLFTEIQQRHMLYSASLHNSILSILEVETVLPRCALKLSKTLTLEHEMILD